MSIKPSVVFIKGVHSTTGSDKTSDIGFPQLELEKLFEGAASKKVGSGETYDSSKKYIYYDSSNSQVVIQDGGHFNCIKNGYYSIADGVSHYYTLSGTSYNYNTVPDTSTWAGKWSFSNTIKDRTLYSINPESSRICINGGYYEKSGNNYIKQATKSYDLYKEGQQVFLDDGHKYKQVYSETKDGDEIIIWKKSSDQTLATSGFYLLINEELDANKNKIYNIKLCSLTFNSNGTTSDNLIGALYKLDTDNSFVSNTWYIKNSNKLEKIAVNTSIVSNADPTENSSFYLYKSLGSYTYPNTAAPVSASLYTDSGSSVYKDFNINNFPVYTNAAITEIFKPSSDSYTIYEQSTVKVNYLYSGTDNSLKFVFTDKTIPEVIKVCGLPDNIGLEKYVHLTNLNYNR